MCANVKYLYAPVTAKNPKEYWDRAQDLEARGYKPYKPMRKIMWEQKHYELHQDSQGRRFSRNEYKGSHDYCKYMGVFRKVEA